MALKYKIGVRWSRTLLKIKSAALLILGCIVSWHRVTCATVTDRQKKPMSYTIFTNFLPAQIIIPIIISHYFTMTRHFKLLNRHYFVNVGGLCYIFLTVTTHSLRFQNKTFCSFCFYTCFSLMVLTYKCFRILNKSHIWKYFSSLCLCLELKRNRRPVWRHA